MGNSSSQRTKEQMKRADPLTTQNSKIIDFVMKKDIKIPKEYKVKSPPLGKGPLGEIRDGYNTILGQRRIIKILYKDEMEEEELIKLTNEYKMVESLSHPNLMKVYEFTEDENYFYIILEYFVGRPLIDKLRDEGVLQEQLAAKIMKEVLQFLKFLHFNHIVYRDLKLENIIYNGKEVKFMDFALAKKIVNKQKLKEGVGSPYYIAPEVIKGKYDYSCDIWSFGVVLYMLLKGKPPFFGKQYGKVMENILKKDINFNDDETLGLDAADLLSRIFIKKPERRITIEEIEEHPFFKQDLNIKEVTTKDIFLEVWQNMKNFRYSNSLQMALYYYIANNIANRRKIRHMKDLFQRIDRNSTGKMTKKDIKNFCAKNNIGINSDSIHIVFKNIDFNQEGYILYEEFLASGINRADLLSIDNIKNCFNSFDSDQVGVINFDDFSKIFDKIDPTIVDNLIYKVDANEDGMIDFREFKACLREITNAY